MLHWVKNEITNLKRWSRNGVISYSKDIVLLFALGKLRAGEKIFTFDGSRKEITKLIRSLSAKSKSNPSYPFWRLQSSTIWTVTYEGRLEKRKSNTDPTIKSLIECKASGGFSQSALHSIQSDKDILDIAKYIVSGCEFNKTDDEVLFEANITN